MPDNDKVLMTNVGVVDTDDGSMEVMKGYLRSFICPHCSGTHIECVVEGMKVSVVLDAADAEAWAEMIMNPTPAPTSDLVNARRLDLN